jgi:exodeoxyribonuclease V alpha subunit
MQQRNNYELDVFNGDVGIVASVDDASNNAAIQFDGRTVAYPHDSLDELDLAYAGTVHKSQGSEYPAVILALLPQHYMLLQRNVLYTGLTRAKQLVVIVGDPRSVQRAARTTESARRHTALADRLRAALGKP